MGRIISINKQQANSDLGDNVNGLGIEVAYPSSSLGNPEGVPAIRFNEEDERTLGVVYTEITRVREKESLGKLPIH
jgi:hypothetical protein